MAHRHWDKDNLPSQHIFPWKNASGQSSCPLSGPCARHSTLAHLLGPRQTQIYFFGKVKKCILTWNRKSPTGGSAYGIPWKAWMRRPFLGRPGQCALTAPFRIKNLNNLNHDCNCDLIKAKVQKGPRAPLFKHRVRAQRFVGVTQILSLGSPLAFWWNGSTSHAHTAVDVWMEALRA